LMMISSNQRDFKFVLVFSLFFMVVFLGILYIYKRILVIY
jgi:hypothetical protein